MIDITHISSILIFNCMIFLGVTQIANGLDIESILTSGTAKLRRSISPESYETQYSSGIQPRVQTSSGLIFGINNSYTHSFFSIPFAVPPLGDLRFKPTTLLNTPELVRNKSEKINVYCSQPGQINEDCLVLSVYVPAWIDLTDAESRPSSQLPVLLFIHGGGFFQGSESETNTDCRYLSEATSAIIVSTNYRLGPLGFLVFDDGEHRIDGNLGLLDQSLALQWIRENIQQFGGDKNRVTIFGSSAGSESVAAHLLMKASQGLFHGAIIQSAPVGLPFVEREEALSTTNRLTSLLRCGILNTNSCCSLFKDDFTCLIEASAEDLTRAAQTIIALSFRSINVQGVFHAFAPYVDRYEIEDQPITLFKEGRWNTSIPIIVGTNKEEFDVFRFAFPIDGYEQYQAINRQVFRDLGNYSADLISEKYIEFYPNIFDFGYIFGIQMTDGMFACPTRALARHASITSAKSVYHYLYDHPPEEEDCENVFGPVCGYSFHGADQLFLFRSLEINGLTPTQSDLLMYDEFAEYWGNFAWTTNSNEGPHSDMRNYYPDWIPYANVKAEASWMSMKLSPPETGMIQNYLKDVCDFWDSIGIYDPAVPSSTEQSTPPPNDLTTSDAHSTRAPDYIFSVLLMIRFLNFS